MPIGASGSSQMRTRDWVFFGRSDQERGGEISSPLQVYLMGMRDSCLKAELISFIFSVINWYR